MAIDVEKVHFQVLARPLPDGTWRARIFEGGVMTWQCSHPHTTIDVAWECGEEQADELIAACSIGMKRHAG